MILNRDRLRHGLRLAVNRLKPNLFITLVFNRDVSYGAGSAAVGEFCKRLERRALGKRWTDYPAFERLEAYAFPEHMQSNPHYHLAGRSGARMCEAALDDAHDLWRHLTKTGHADVQLTNDAAAVASYVTKATRDPRSIEHFVAYAPKLKL